MDFCNAYHLPMSYAANLFETRSTNVAMTTLAGIPLIEIKRTSLEGWGRVLKRVFDIVMGALLLIIFSPVFAVVALLILFDTGRPVFVKLERVGRGGKRFTLYKFRSMVHGAHTMKKDLMTQNERKDGPLFKMRDDPRITRTGIWLRRTSIDELPQFFNALNGSMSLVGPRPHEPEEVSQYTPSQRVLLFIKPGATGLSQVSGRSDLTFEEEVRLDTFYLEHWSLALDLQLLLKTPLVLFRRRSAA